MSTKNVLVNFKKNIVNTKNPDLVDILTLLHKYNKYHYLLVSNADTFKELKDVYYLLPEEYAEWLQICDGGLLFETNLLSTRKCDGDVITEFDSYEDFNNDYYYEEISLPEGYFIFATKSYGDAICFKLDDHNEEVFLWDVNESDFIEIWPTFFDWLKEEIDDAISLINSGGLRPNSMKN